MKKLVFLMFAFIIANSGQAQVGKEFSNKYSGSEGVRITYISSGIFDMMGQEIKDAQFGNISLESFQGMYVIACDDSATIKRIKKDIDLKIQNEYELLIENKEDDECTRIYRTKTKKRTDTIGLIVITEESEDINIVFIDAASMKKSKK